MYILILIAVIFVVATKESNRRQREAPGGAILELHRRAHRGTFDQAEYGRLAKGFGYLVGVPDRPQPDERLLTRAL